jgi:biotin carboxyl carrier protein
MKYTTTVDGHTYEFEISAEGAISIGGEILEVDFQAVADQPVYSLILGGQSYQASVDPTESGLEVLLRGRLYSVIVEDERQRRLRRSSAAVQKQTGEYKLKAPMPGLVVAIPVEAGQQVSKGQNLVILESMKMQNELKAPRDGKVLRVPVQAGDNVDQNQVMLILE